MERIKHELTGYKIPSYVEDILSMHYCPGFMRMNMIRNQDTYNFSYEPGAYKRLDHSRLTLYQKLILIKTLITLAEQSKEQLISPESYLIEPELIYLKNGGVSISDVIIMYYPDIKSLSYRYKIVLFADRIMDKGIAEEREALDQIRQASESGDINRIKISLDKQIIRCENRMADGRIFS